MGTGITIVSPHAVDLPAGLPPLITAAGERAAWRFVESFTATIRNPHTREAYARAVGRFLARCESRGLRDLWALTPVVVAAYIKQLPGSKPTVKQHLSAIRQCLDWLVTGGALEANPAASVRGPTYVIKKGKTPVLDTAQTRAPLEAQARRCSRSTRPSCLLAAYDKDGATAVGTDLSRDHIEELSREALLYIRHIRRTLTLRHAIARCTQARGDSIRSHCP
jgi:hypothetical protein